MATSITAPMVGKIVAVRAQQGDRIEPGQALMTLASMKLESAVCAPCGGVLAKIHVAAGSAVEEGDTLATIV